MKRMFGGCVFGLLVTLLVVNSGTGCSNQGEGERCSTASGNSDCADGLVCTPHDKLGTNADLCCPPENVAERVKECVYGSGVGGAGGTSGTGGTSGSGGTAGTAGTGGSSGSGGSSGTGGTAGSGGSAGTAGTGGTSGASGTGGTSGSGGTAGAGGGP